MALMVSSLLIDLGLSHTEAVKALGQARGILNETKRSQSASESRQDAFIKVCSWHFTPDLLQAGSDLREALQGLKDESENNNDRSER